MAEQDGPRDRPTINTTTFIYLLLILLLLCILGPSSYTTLDTSSLMEYTVDNLATATIYDISVRAVVNTEDGRVL